MSMLTLPVLFLAGNSQVQYLVPGLELLVGTISLVNKNPGTEYNANPTGRAMFGLTHPTAQSAAGSFCIGRFN